MGTGIYHDGREVVPHHVPITWCYQEWAYLYYVLTPNFDHHLYRQSLFRSIYRILQHSKYQSLYRPPQPPQRGSVTLTSDSAESAVSSGRTSFGAIMPTLEIYRADGYNAAEYANSARQNNVVDSPAFLPFSQYPAAISQFSLRPRRTAPASPPQ